jgi:hypothetical protein
MGRRVWKTILPAAALILSTIVPPAWGADGTVMGQNVAGRVGLGMLSPETPIGVRYFWTRRFGFEIGVGLQLGEHRPRYLFEAAGLVALAPGTRTNTYLRPGVRYITSELEVEPRTTVQFSLSAGIEHFLSGSFAVTAGAGVAVDFVSPESGAGDWIEGRTVAGSWTQLGFLFYFPPSR